MEINLCGRNVDVPEHFRDQIAERLDRLARYDHKIGRLAVELSHEPNPRRAKNCQCVQITGRGQAPVVRAEGCAGDFQSALDLALNRLEARLRRAHDRRKVHHGRRQPVSVARATADAGPGVAVLERTAADPDPEPEPGGGSPGAIEEADGGWDDGSAYVPGQIVRRKEHHAVPMHVDDALSQMELVGHDFFLFADVETGRPSVVYRRRGFDYGVIALA